jgi:hypothetical protein
VRIPGGSGPLHRKTHGWAKLLSRHPLEQQDLVGNLEDPRKGWQRRLLLLMVNRILDDIISSAPVRSVTKRRLAAAIVSR